MKSVPRSVWVGVGVLVAAAVLTAMYRPGYVQRRAMELKLEAAQAEQQELEARHGELAARVDRLKHDPLELEREARQQLGLVRPGEVIYKFPQNQKP